MDFKNFVISFGTVESTLALGFQQLAAADEDAARRMRALADGYQELRREIDLLKAARAQGEPLQGQPPKEAQQSTQAH